MQTTTTPQHTARGAPHTPTGRWTVILMALSWAGLVGMAVAFAAGLDHGEGPTDNWVTTIWATLVLVGAATATVLGVRAMVALHDRAGAVIAATLLAALLSLVVLREAIQGIVG